MYIAHCTTGLGRSHAVSMGSRFPDFNLWVCSNFDYGYRPKYYLELAIGLNGIEPY